MTVEQLVHELTRMIQAGEITPQTPVVRPFCMCEDNYGWENVHKVAVVHPEPSDSGTPANAVQLE